MPDPAELADIYVPPGPGIPRGLLVPASELHERFARSSGPGGQSVNTTDSRVELRFRVVSSPSLTESQRARLQEALGEEVLIRAAAHRSQHRNRVRARERLVERLRAALAPPPPPRVPTKPSKASRRRRVEAKRRRGNTKAMRGRVRDSD